MFTPAFYDEFQQIIYDIEYKAFHRYIGMQPDREEIYGMLLVLSERIKNAGINFDILVDRVKNSIYHEYWCDFDARSIIKECLQLMKSGKE